MPTDVTVSTVILSARSRGRGGEASDPHANEQRGRDPGDAKRPAAPLTVRSRRASSPVEVFGLDLRPHRVDRRLVRRQILRRGVLDEFLQSFVVHHCSW
jgi:hypothetical protein